MTPRAPLAIACALLFGWGPDGEALWYPGGADVDAAEICGSAEQVEGIGTADLFHAAMQSVVVLCDASR